MMAAIFADAAALQKSDRGTSDADQSAALQKSDRGTSDADQSFRELLCFREEDPNGLVEMLDQQATIHSASGKDVRCPSFSQLFASDEKFAHYVFLFIVGIRPA